MRLDSSKRAIVKGLLYFVILVTAAILIAGNFGSQNYAVVVETTDAMMVTVEFPDGEQKLVYSSYPADVGDAVRVEQRSGGEWWALP